MAAGAELANALAYKGLADQLSALITYVRSSGLVSAKGGRPKRSETILNPCSKPRYLLKLKRRILRLSDKLRSS